MITIGVTGGIGAGKSRILEYLQEKHHAFICQTDLEARVLQEPQGDCFPAIVESFGSAILDAAGRLDREKLAKLIFSDRRMRERLNGIVHPAVKKRVLFLRGQAERNGFPYFVIESALLLEDRYDEMCDETWYIYADESVRMKRLKNARNYPEEKIQAIFVSQLPESVFRNRCSRTIDNSGSFSVACSQVDARMIDLEKRNNRSKDT